MSIIRRPQPRIFPMVALTPEQRRDAADQAKTRMDMSQSYGEDPVAWRGTRREAQRLLRASANRRGKMTYSELVSALTEGGYLSLDAHGTPLAAMLGQINILEMESGDPMITAVVVLKNGSSAPGVGFWNLAESAGLFSATASEEEQDRFWTAEFNECHRVWSARSRVRF